MRAARREWIRDLTAEELGWTRDQVADVGFWHYVDSQKAYYSHPGECPVRSTVLGDINTCTIWPHVRDEGQCVAANAQGTRCAQWSRKGIPFCEFHFDRAWEATLAFVTAERDAEVVRNIAFDRRQFYLELNIDRAAVLDAKRLLATSAEQVYFFRVDNAVKVGRSIDPAKRVRTLAGTKAPEGIDTRVGELLGTIPGGSYTEGQLHQEFRRHRLVGEWFEYEPIAADIAHLIESRNTEEAA